MKKVVLALLVLGCCIPTLTQAQPWAHSMDDTLSTVVVTVTREKMRNTTQTGLMRLDADALKKGAVSFGTPDIIKTLLTLPGVSAGNELMGGMYVHGGDGTDNLYLLDGVPLYNISHFGGVFSSFNTDVTGGLDFYKSGFPARYGSRLSSVVDVDTKPGDMQKYKGSLSLGAIDGRINLEGPIVRDRTSFNFAYRRSWLDMMIWLATKIDGAENPPRAAYFMNDLNLGLTHDISKDNRLRVNFFWGKDDLDMGLKQDGLSLDLAELWGSMTFSGSWDWKISPTLRSNLLAYYTQSTSLTSYGLGLGNQGSLSDDIDSGIHELGLKYDLNWFVNENNRLRAGIDVARKNYHFKGQAEDISDPDSPSPTVDNSGWDNSFYLEDEIFILYNLTLNAGMRLISYVSDNTVYNSFEPRAAFKWAPSHLCDVKLSFSRMSQSDHLVSSSYLDLPSNTWMPSNKSIGPVTSDQISGGVYLRPFKGAVFNLEGWYKTMDHILYYVGPNSMFPPVQNWENSFVEGRGLSYGLESELSWANERVSASAYYTLSWSKRRFEEVYPDWFYANSDNRHKINLLFSVNLGHGLEANANWNYHTGNRITLPTNALSDGTLLYGEPFNTTLPDYHRLDFSLSWSRATKLGNSLETNLSVYNLYNNKNAFFAYVSKDEDGNFVGKAFSILPVFPTVSVTYKF